MKRSFLRTAPPLCDDAAVGPSKSLNRMRIQNKHARAHVFAYTRGRTHGTSHKHTRERAHTQRTPHSTAQHSVPGTLLVPWVPPPSPVPQQANKQAKPHLDDVTLHVILQHTQRLHRSARA